jgi:predicted nucleic acid-binding protein
MTSFFPDLNVWLALSVSGHSHSRRAWQWLDGLTDEVTLLFSRYTQIGLLRLLTNASVMGGADRHGEERVVGI